MDELVELSKGKQIEKDLEPAVVLKDINSKPGAVYSIMVMSGYLNAVPDGRNYLLSIPNKEMFGVFAKVFLGRISSKLFGIISDMADALVSGNTKTLAEETEEFLNTVVGNRVLEHEKEYQSLLGGAFCILADRYDVKIDMEAGNGFCDLRMRSLKNGEPHICIEFKKVKSETQTEKAAAEALEQIKDR